MIPSYIKTMGIPLVRGRLLERLDGDEGRAVAVVNQALVDRYFRDRDPIGEMLQMPMAGELEIVGVVGNTRHGGLQSEIEPELYVPFMQMPFSDMHFVVATDVDLGAVARAVSGRISELDPELVPTSVTRIDEMLWESVAQPRFNTALLVGLAMCAGLLAAVGIYGIVSYSVVQRTGEIGVRMALGADRQATVSLVIRHAMTLVGIGSVVGIGISLAAARFLEQMLFDVEPTDIATYTIVTSSALMVGLCAAALPARRATRIDPIVALRND